GRRFCGDDSEAQPGMRGYWAIVRKEVVHIRRDPTTLIFALVFPFIQLTIFGYAIDFDVRHIPTVVVDQDKSRESRQYLEQLQATEYLDLTSATDSPEEATSIIKSGRAKVGVVIPPDFARLRAAKKTAQVGVLIDGSDSTTAIRARFAFVSPSGTPDVE